MKRKFAVIFAAALLSSSILFSSCIGSFRLCNKLLVWNRTLHNDEWVNELVYVLLWIVPAYPVTTLIDVFVLNTIEFWMGENPVDSTVQTRQIETDKGIYMITTDAGGHKIQRAGSDEIVEFRFNKEEKSWSLITPDQSIPLFRFVEGNQAEVYLADGSTMTVDLNRAGVMALRQVIEDKAYFAVK
jgi:hypothetical protein